MSEHTPGPWTISGQSGRLRVITSNGTPICKLEVGQHRTEAEIEANAYLIESAPALLEALEKAACFVEDDICPAHLGKRTACLEDSNCEQAQPLYRELDAVLKLAKGEN
ncbi:hypothetical protein LCGC14_1381950 [marine sediment metagenome]|uniref:Uncharacterized protein n=1 Tax=marine sediment metagenome TaxID=412755 RepID=A0A0F9KN78_9ZZZZ